MSNKTTMLNYVCIMHILCGSLTAQLDIKSVTTVPLPDKGSINNPVWSIDSKQIAFEFLRKKDKSNVLLYRVNTNQQAKPILEKTESDSPLILTVNKTSSRLPYWSIVNDNTLYFLYENKSKLHIKKLEDLRYEKTPRSVTNIEPVIENEKESGISEYHTANVENVEYIFIRQQDSPGSIHYTEQYERLFPIPELNRWIKTDETIDSFFLSNNAGKIIICKGKDKLKTLILGHIHIDEDDLNSIEFANVSIPKTEDGVLQEPSFNPTSTDMIAYLEMVRKHDRVDEYHLFIQTLDSNTNHFLTDNLYRNENNKTSRPNSNSYVWHPNGDYIFYITTDAKRNVAYIDLKNLNQPKINMLNTGIEFAEQISISPNGKHLALMTQIAREEDKGALGQLYRVELSY